eukprot:11049873-Lingulodinium_polyedra.AAC.1
MVKDGSLLALVPVCTAHCSLLCAENIDGSWQCVGVIHGMLAQSILKAGEVLVSSMEAGIVDVG